MAPLVHAAIARHILDACRSRPLLTGVVAATTKGALADVASQALLQRDREYEPTRTAAFALWNGLYCGLVVYALYTVMIPRMWPTKLSSGSWHPLARRHVALSVCFDNLFATPFLCLPTYYACLAFMEATWAELRRPTAILARALTVYRSEARETLSLSLGIWIPVHVLTFSLVPVDLRTHWVACCSFVALSFMSLLQASLERRRMSRETGERQQDA